MDNQTMVIFEYQYRDASNYKVQSSVLLSGELSSEQKNQIIGKFDDKQFFIAEQLGVPTLYHMLFEFSNGVTTDDHVWHEFLQFQDGQLSAFESRNPCMSASDFFSCVMEVDCWNIALSPNYG